MLARRITIVLGAVVLIGGYVLMNVLAGMKEEPKKMPEIDKTPNVFWSVVKNDTIQNSIAITGRVFSRRKIQVLSEVQGIYRPGTKEFKDGVSFSKSELMLSLEPGEMKMNLYAQKSSFLNAISQVLPDLEIDFPEQASKWEDYVLAFEMEKSLPELPKVKENKLQLFLTSRNIYSAYYNLRAQEITLSKYQITAPFDGVVTMSNVNPGTLVRPGQILGEFSDPTDFELDAAISAKDAQFVRVGDDVNLTDQASKKVIKGKVVRLGSQLDVETQSIKVYIGIRSADLSDGSYLGGAIRGRDLENVLQVDRNILDNGRIFLIEEEQLVPTEANVLRYTETRAIISGLKDGDKFLNQSLNGAYNGMKVRLVK